MKKILIITIILLNFISIINAQRTFEIPFWNKGEKININSIGIMELSVEKYHAATSNLTIMDNYLILQRLFHPVTIQ